MDFRTLIERAMHEAQAEFAEIVKRKLNALLGSTVRGASPKRPAERSSRSFTVASPRVNKRKPVPAKPTGTRSAPEAMDALGHKVLEALATGAPLSRGAIARMVGVEATSAVLGNVLGKLRRDRQIVMDGQKRNARYMAA
jgi:hypothetical protein